MDWNSAYVILLFKKGGKKRNYRLVGLTFVVGKMLESLMKDKTDHLEMLNVIEQSLSGFMKGKSA